MDNRYLSFTFVLQKLCKDFSEYCHQQSIIKYKLITTIKEI